MKKFLQKRLSVFLALLMVFSMFAFSPDMFTEAQAASNDTFGPHKVRMWLDVGSDEWECDSGKQLKILYRTKRNDTSSLSAVICTTSSNNFNTTNKKYYLGNATNSAGMDDESGREGIIVNGFPVGWDFSTMKSNNSCQDAGFTAHIEVWNENTGSWNEVGQGSDKVGKGGTFAKKDGIISLTGTTAPNASRVEFENPGSGEVTVKTSGNASVSGSKAATVYDQYGVVLTTTDLTYKLYDSETGTGTSFNPNATVSKTSDNKPVVTVLPGASEWILSGGGTQRSLYAQAVCGSANSGSDRYEVIVSNYTVRVDYNLNGGSYWGTEDDQSTTAYEEVNYGGYLTAIPTAAYRLGHTFNGIYSAASGGSLITASTQIKAAATYYAQWTAIDNPVEFYNSDGQLIQRFNSKFGTTISAVGSPSTPSYPGKTNATDKNYAFQDWIVWDAPNHPDWVGTSISAHATAKLDSPTAGEVLKFIATYKLNGTVKTYTANFLNAGGFEIGSTTGAYWTAVTPYDTVTKPGLAQGVSGSAVTKANGFDLDNYDYTFEGWTTHPSNAKWGTEDDVEYTSEDIIRIREDITFYPCYSKSIKQCVVTKKYYALNETGAPVVRSEVVAKSAETELGATFNLGAAEPFSFNFSGYTYTFKGWKKTTSSGQVSYGTGTADIVYSGGKAETVLTGDVYYFAVYEKTEIKYNTYYYNGTNLIMSFDDLSRYDNSSALITYTIADQFNGETPVRARAGQTGFTFVGWVEDQTKVLNPEAGDLVTSYTFGEQSKSFYAAYSSFDYYTVTFRNDDGSTIQTSSDYVAGNVIAYTAAEPAADAEMFIPVVSNKASGVQFQYTFMGWKSNVEDDNTLTFEDETAGTVYYAVASGSDIEVNADRVYTAVYMKEIREYQISLYDIGVNPELKVNEDGYGVYTNEGAEYFVKNDSIFTKSGDEYVPYEGELKLKDLEAVKSEAITVLTLKYGENILDAVKALYAYSGDASDRNVTSVAGSDLMVLPYGEEEKQVIPYTTDQYAYAFNGWNPAINPNATVIGDAAYVATYRTDNVLYNAHWYTPTSFGPGEDYAPLSFTEQVTNYRYKRAIAVPAKTPTAAAPATKANYTWSFLGWYECDANKVIKTDAEGNEIKYTKGTLADPGDNHNRDFYYVAKFGFVANEYTVRVYDETGATLLGTYMGAYDTDVNLVNFVKAFDENYHYALTSFVDKTSNAVVVSADTDSDTTAYTVKGNIDLKVLYAAEIHDWTANEPVVTTVPTYQNDGLRTYTCPCGYKRTEVIDKLVDKTGPVGKVAIKSYNWDKDGGADEAYVRADSLIAIMAVDRGQNAEAINEGNGIKSISYTWSNSAQGGTFEYNEFEKTSANVDVQLPTGSDFTDGMTLTAVITDWTGRTYTITTGGLYVDSVKPVIEIEKTCEGFRLGVIEEHLNRVTATLDGEAFDGFDAYAQDGSSLGYAAAYVGEKTETELVAEGVYVVTAADKAGNTATVTFEITNAHEWNDGKVTIKATCTEDGTKVFTCTACGDTKSEVIPSTGHEWDEEYKVDKNVTCTEDGEKSIYCTVCGEMMPDSTVIIPSEGHDYVENEKAATCKAAGYKVVTCNNCDLYEYTTYAQLEHSVKLDAEGADENGWLVGKAATCTAEGYNYQVCANCGEQINKTKTDIVPHNFEDVTPEGDYCTAQVVEGATADTYHLYKCADCGYSYVFNTEAKEHKIVKTVKSEPTCTEDRVYTVSCEKGDMTEKEEVERLTSLGGHQWEERIDSPATCTVDGSKSMYCANCGELKEGSTVVIPAGHSYEKTKVKATCHTEAKNVYTCSVCSDTYEEITGPALPSLHKWNDGVVTKPATCAEEGEMTYTCTECSETETEAITKTAHEAGTEVVSHTDATCIDVEKTVYKCKNCDEGTVTVNGTTYAEHVKGALLRTDKAATCVEDGLGIYKCTVCEDSFPFVIPADGTSHRWNVWSDWEETTAATCTAKGSEKAERACLNDGCTAVDVKTRDIDALGHNLVVDHVGAPVTVDGVTTITTYYVCTRCDYTKSEDAVTTLYTITVDGNAIDLVNGEKLTEEKIAEALGTLPSKDAAAEDKDGVYEVVWMLDGVETKLPATVSANAVLTYDFRFVANTYTVTFYNQTGKVISQTAYVKGSTVTVPDDIFVSGYRFLGWTDGENEFAPDAIPAVTESVSYRPWIVSNDNFKTYYVTFKNETGTKTLYTATVEAGLDGVATFNLPADLATPTKNANTVYHFTFDGWLDTAEAKVTFPVDITGNATFKASFKVDKHDDNKSVISQLPATCTSAENTTYQCVCGYTWNVYTAPATGHDYREIGRTQDGNTTIIDYICHNCGDSYKRTVTAGSQSDVIVVKVTDGAVPVEGARVVVYKGSLTAIEAFTDANGCAYFSKDSLPDGTYQTKVTKDNYDSAAGQMTVKNGTATLKLTMTKQQCHCVCHANSFFGKIRRFFNKFMRLFNKNYTCCSCGECERIY